MPFLKNRLLPSPLSEAVGENFFVSYPYGGRFENVKSVASVAADKIVLEMKKCLLVLTGENMRIRSYTASDVTVEGRIICVSRC